MMGRQGALAGQTGGRDADPRPLTTDTGEAAEALGRFVATVAMLRGPQGCPWDRRQTHVSIARNMVEEAYEAAQAMEDGDPDELCGELGDVLLQVVLQAQIAADEGEFTIADVARAADAKMVRRHPHVFGVEASAAALGVAPEELAHEAGEVDGAEDVASMWDRIKLIEHRQDAERRRARASQAGDGAGATGGPGERGQGLMDDVPRMQPALMQAQGIVRKAAAAGFFWDERQGAWDKVSEELGELADALRERASVGGGRAAEAGDMLGEGSGESVAGAKDAWQAAQAHATDELGDVLFSLVCVAHQEGLDAEAALMSTLAKFRRRWAIIERGAREQGKAPEELTLAEQDALWEQAKAQERRRGTASPDMR